jgi:putative flippase GtrA
LPLIYKSGYINDNIILSFLKFSLVGLSGMAVDFGVTWLFKEKVKINKFAANALGFSCAVSSNYFLNRWWTFHSTNPNITNEYVSFFAVSAVGLAINTLVLWVLVTKFKRNFYISKLFAIFITAVWNFSINFIYTFK